METTSTIQAPSKGSEIAKTGNKAQVLMTANSQVKSLLQEYFTKSIESIVELPGRKKTDLIIRFADSSVAKCQLKHGKGDGRGHSVDRRSLTNFPLDDTGKELLSNVCLKKGTNRPIVNNPLTLIPLILLGVEEDAKPTHFICVRFDPTTDELLYLSIATTEKVIEKLQERTYTAINPKRTCVHISPDMYLQRKGGGKKDSRPDDIQTKLKSFPEGTMNVIYEKP